MTEPPTNDFDELLRAAARDYNRPGEPPRDRMWESIRAERARRTRFSRPAPWRRFVLPALAAAVLILAFAIGREYERMTDTRAPGQIATKPTVVSDSTRRLPNASPAERPALIAEKPESTPSQSPIAPRATRHVPREQFGSSNLTLRLAVVEHLAGTEAMLTSFRDEAARGEVDAQITSWARRLLTTTRLLEASAAQQDPTMKRLLDDLELVLVQIAQYSNTNPHRAEELELIEHSIQRRGVIEKLRTTVPARLTPSGT